MKIGVVRLDCPYAESEGYNESKQLYDAVAEFTKSEYPVDALRMSRRDDVC